MLTRGMMSLWLVVAGVDFQSSNASASLKEGDPVAAGNKLFLPSVVPFPPVRPPRMLTIALWFVSLFIPWETCKWLTLEHGQVYTNLLDVHDRFLEGCPTTSWIARVDPALHCEFGINGLGAVQPVP
jgi:hypothetical protein